MSDVIILGGGVSGLASAYFLSKKSISCTLVEANSCLGGLIHTDSASGCQLEAGPDSYIAVKSDVTQLANEIPELKNQLIGTNDTQRRIYIVKDGVLQPLPSGMVMMVPGDMRAALSSSLFSEETKKHILKERFFKPCERQEDVSIADLVVEHFDRALLESVVEPLLTGVYGGDAGRLSAQSVLPRFLEYERRYGSLVRAVKAEKKAADPDASMFLSFKGGMQAFTDALYHASAGSITRVHGEATHIERQSSDWRITVNGAHESAKFLIIALPTHRAAPLCSSELPGLASELAAIPYSSAITATVIYKSEAVVHPLDGFGFLVPRLERKRLAACTWINTKFPQRISPGLVALRAFIVDADADEMIPQPDEAILATIRSEFSRLMGIEAEPVHHVIYRWPLSMPQYVVGHRLRVERIRGRAAAAENLFVVGNAYDGIGVPDCVRLARQAADQIEI